MKKMIKCMSAYLIILVLTTSFRPAGGTGITDNSATVDNYIYGLYSHIDFGNNKLSYDVFSKACKGFLNLRSEGKLSQSRDILTVCDFSLSSAQNRMWIIDLGQKKVLYNTFVAHGQGSGEEYACAFSNRNNSHQSSLGFYVTGETYDGEHGTSLRLQGMDQGFNDAALDRGIVVHGAEYVSEKFIKDNDHLGRSWGCPAVPSNLSLPIINTIKDSTCLFIYYPEETYLHATCWLNKKIANLPGNVYQDMQCMNALPQAAMQPAKPKIVRIEYRNHNGTIDSVKTFPPAP